MIDTSTTLVKLLDLSRGTGIGSDGVLSLLDHDPDRGYAVLVASVDGGWAVELGSLDQVQTLVIIEHDDVDAEVLARTRAFSIDGVIYEFVSGYKVQSPEPNSPTREWQFRVAPTSEVLS